MDYHYRFRNQKGKNVHEPRNKISRKLCHKISNFYRKSNLTEFLDWIMFVENILIGARCRTQRWRLWKLDWREQHVYGYIAWKTTYRKLGNRRLTPRKSWNWRWNGTFSQTSICILYKSVFLSSRVRYQLKSWRLYSRIPCLAIRNRVHESEV